MKSGAVNLRKPVKAAKIDGQGAPLSGRYEKRLKPSHKRELDNARKNDDDDLDDETRSLTAEIDYTRKDATRHIVQNARKVDGGELRQKLLGKLD